MTILANLKSRGRRALKAAFRGTAAFALAASVALAAPPSSTITLPNVTTAYSSGQLIANSATAGSVINPSFVITNQGANSTAIYRLRLSTNDTTSTAWGAVPINVDLWSCSPTWTNGDRGTWSPATGAACHLATFSCTMSAEYGDGAYAECAPVVNNASVPKLPSGSKVYWSLETQGASGVTAASKTFTMTPELVN